MENLVTGKWEVVNITDQFETPLYWKWRRSKKIYSVTSKQDTSSQLAVQLSQEREEIYSRVLGIDKQKKEFSRRAHIEQLDDGLRKKLDKVFRKKGFQLLNRYNGFFVYHPRGSRSILVLPRMKSSQLDFFLIKGLALRAVQINTIKQLIRVHTYVPDGVFLEEKVLEKDEYDEAVKNVIEEFCASLV